MLSPWSLPIPQIKHKMNLFNRLKIDRSQAIVGWGRILHLQFKNDKDLMLVNRSLKKIFVEIRSPSNVARNFSKRFNRPITTIQQFHNVCCYGKLGCVGVGEGRGGKGTPFKRFVLLVSHLPISCADAAGEYWRQTAYLSTHNGAICAPSHHILLPTTTVNRTNAHTRASR